MTIGCGFWSGLPAGDSTVNQCSKFLTGPIAQCRVWCIITPNMFLQVDFLNSKGPLSVYAHSFILLFLCMVAMVDFELTFVFSFSKVVQDSFLMGCLGCRQIGYGRKGIKPHMVLFKDQCVQLPSNLPLLKFWDFFVESPCWYGDFFIAFCRSSMLLCASLKYTQLDACYHLAGHIGRTTCSPPKCWISGVTGF